MNFFRPGINAVEVVGGIGAATLVNRQFVPNLYTLRLNRLEWERNPVEYDQEFRAAHHAVLGGFLATTGVGALMMLFPQGRDAGVVMIASAGLMYFTQRRFLSQPCHLCKRISKRMGHDPNPA